MTTTKPRRAGLGALALALALTACTGTEPNPVPTTWAPEVDVADDVQPLNDGMKVGDTSVLHPGGFEDGRFAVDVGEEYVLVAKGEPIPEVALGAIDEALAAAAATALGDAEARSAQAALAGEVTYLTTGMDLFAVFPQIGWDGAEVEGYGVWWYALGGYEPSMTSMFTADAEQVEAWVEEMVERPTYFYDGTGDVDLPKTQLPKTAQVAEDDISERAQIASGDE